MANAYRWASALSADRLRPERTRYFENRPRDSCTEKTAHFVSGLFCAEFQTVSGLGGKYR
jgi:hypothetical protein